MLVFFTISCEKDNKNDSQWQKFSDKNNYLVNSKNCIATDENLLIYGNECLSKLSNINDIMHYYIMADVPKSKKFPISSNYFIEYGPYGIYFIPTKNPTLLHSQANVNLSTIDTNFVSIDFDGFNRLNSTIGINENEFCLVPYINKTCLHPSFYLISLSENYDNSGFSYLELSSFKKIELINDNSPHVSYIGTFGDNFLVSTDTDTYMITQNDEYSIILDRPILNNFILNGYLYVTSGGDLLVSKDNGISWTSECQIPDELLSHQFIVLNTNLLFAYNNSSLFQIKIQNNNLIKKEIPTEGLQNSDITSICIFHNFIFVTTNTGLFYKTVDECL